MLSQVSLRFPLTPNGAGASTQAPMCASISARTIAVVMVFRPAMIAVTPTAVIAPMAAAVVNHRRRSIITRRLIDYRGRCSPTKRVDIYVEACVGVGARACDQRKRDSAKWPILIFHDKSSLSCCAWALSRQSRRDKLRLSLYYFSCAVATMAECLIGG